MAVGQDESIDPVEPILNTLHPKLGRSVDLYMVAAHFHVNGGTRAPVLGIIQVATFSLRLSNHGHALRSARS